MLKHDVRKLFLQKRNALTHQEVAELSGSIYKSFNDLLEKKPKTVHIYLPIVSKNELDTWPIIHGLWDNNIRTVVPVINPKNETLGSFELTRETILKENYWKVYEPHNSTSVKIEEIDTIILPLLAFDKNGYRVGYGKGFYDKYLASTQKRIRKIGLSFFDPIAHISDIDSWDIPMDYCITPTKTFKF